MLTGCVVSVNVGVMKAQHPEIWAAEKIIKLLEEGGLPPWRKGWISRMPQNMISKREYNGLNRWMLMMAPYSSPFYMTLKNVQSLGGRVKYEEFTKNSWPVYFWMFKEYNDKVTGEKKKNLFCKGYRVWNIEQCEGITEDKIPNLDQTFNHNPIEECEKVIAGFKSAPAIEHVGGRCCYAPLEDKIKMPTPESFKASEEYYSSLFHECGHSTGHKSRLNRELDCNFGSHDYSREELVAEFCAAMLCANTGIAQSTIENSAAYVKNWLDKLKGNPEMLVFASREANKAYNHILGNSFNKEDV